MFASTNDLRLGGRLLIWTARHWARGRRQGHDLPGFVQRTLRQLPTGTKIQLQFESLLAQVTLGARHPLAFAPPESRTLLPDERILMLSLHAATLDLAEESRAVLADLVARNTLDPAARAAQALGTTLSAAHLSLPRAAATQALATMC